MKRFIHQHKKAAVPEEYSSFFIKFHSVLKISIQSKTFPVQVLQKLYKQLHQ